jgi:hypothetical protein
MLSLIAAGTLGFWIFLGVCLVLMGILLENEYEFWASAILLILVVAYGHHFSLAALLVGGLSYLIVGGIWSLGKWYLFVQDYVQNRDKNEHKSWSSDKLTKEEQDEQWVKQAKTYLRPNNHKSKITGWISAWPVSIVWTVIRDSVKTVYNNLSKQYEKIVDNCLSPVK